MLTRLNTLRLGRQGPLVALAAAIIIGIAIQLSQMPVAAQTGGYRLTWNTVDSGGRSSGGVYSLSGTVGQPVAAADGGGYKVAGGFWTAALKQLRLYLPAIRR